MVTPRRWIRMWKICERVGRNPASVSSFPLKSCGAFASKFRGWSFEIKDEGGMDQGQERERESSLPVVSVCYPGSATSGNLFRRLVLPNGSYKFVLRGEGVERKVDLDLVSRRLPVNPIDF